MKNATERQRHRQREKQASHREPNVGLDPGTAGSHPEPKVDAQPLSYSRVPYWNFLKLHIMWYNTTRRWTVMLESYALNPKAITKIANLKLC